MTEKLITSVTDMMEKSPEVAVLLGLNHSSFEDFGALAGAVLGQACQNTRIGEIIQRVYSENPIIAEQSHYDIAETARRNFEPGGQAATLLFAHGVHAIMAHRVAHQLWRDGDHTLALAVKTVCGRTFTTDIHPAAQIGAGLWLDHGLGFVVGETSVICENVSIWHNVTLGSTLTDSGLTRHPKIEHSAVIGAGAILLGNINIGAAANVAAGAIVVEDVPPATVVVGAKARNIGVAKVSFAPILKGQK